MLRKLVLFCVAAGSLVACTNNRNVAFDEPLMLERGTALVVGSVTDECDSVGFMGQRWGRSSFSWKNLDTGEIGTFRPMTDDPLENSEAGGLFRQFGCFRGQLIARKMPAGRYALTNWSISTSAYTYSGLDLEPLNFNLKSGDIVYIGNLNMVLQYGENLFGMTMVAGGLPQINDYFDRDMRLLKATFPKINFSKAKNKTLDISPWFKGPEGEEAEKPAPKLEY